MGTRDRFERKIKCEKCPNEGTLHMSEKDCGWASNMDTQIEKIEGDFDAIIKDFEGIIVTCNKCGKTFKL